MPKTYLVFLFLLFTSFSVKSEEMDSEAITNEAKNIQSETNIIKSDENNDLLIDEENISEDFVDDNDISSNIKPKPVIYYRSPLKRAAEFAWGEPVDNGILAGMLSYHTNTQDRRLRRWNHNLIGLQYKGFIASTFTNSYNKQSVFLGFGRTIIDAPILHSKLKFQAGYKIGLVYGYKNTPVFNILGFTPSPLPFVGLSYRRIALEIMPVLSREPVISANMRINLYPLENPKAKVIRPK